ncbi:MAG: homoserine kinase [Bacteroidota bacterium]
MSSHIKVRAPATVSNLGCGYDTIGFSLESVYEELELQVREDNLLNIATVTGADLSSDPQQNTATIAIKALLKDLKSEVGFDLTIHKYFTPGSGLGSSASSAAGAVFAANKLLGEPYSKEQLLPFALEGEFFASKSYHADNVAPCLLGGFVVLRSYDPLDFFQLPIPKNDLKCLIIRPDIQIKTDQAKKLIPPDIALKTARNQWGNVAGLVHAFHTNNWSLARLSIHDYIAEPVRKRLITGYDSVKKICLASGSIGFNISGAGPSMFSLFRKDVDLVELKSQVEGVYTEYGIGFETFESGFDDEGCKVVN